MTENKEISLKLTIMEVKIIMSSLAKMPFENVYELIGKINNQANEQTKNK
ncbi:MAG: hypothetical protein II393_04280 [Cytophagales bacterium]|nr:hypothetical protein [Cytophagales bacterium]